jgi:GPH family glycoside/pentoside/hexuronide:cation symporter
VAGIVFGLIVMAVSLTTFFTVMERKREYVKPKLGILRSYLSAFKNGPYLKILIPYALNIVAITTVSGIMQYYFKYVLKAEGMTSVALGIMLLCAIGFMPFWVFLIKKLGKNVAYAIGMAIIAAVCLLIAFLGDILGMWTFVMPMMVVVGLGLSAANVCPWSIIPDTVEYDYLNTGERREGIFYGLWTFTSKTGQAIAVQIMGIVLDLFHYVRPVNNEAIMNQPPEALFGMKFLLGPVTAFFFVAASIAVLFYPLTAKKFEELMTKIKRMEAGK